MTIINDIKKLCADANAAYIFMHEDADMINLKIDGFDRGKKFVYVETMRSGQYVRNPRTRQLSRVFNARIYFCKFGEYTNDNLATPESFGRVSSANVKNDAIIEAIENEIIAPFVALLDLPENMKKFSFGQPIESFPFQYPPSRFDGNELSVMLELRFKIPVCR